MKNIQELAGIVRTAKGSKLHKLTDNGLVCTHNDMDLSYFPLRLKLGTELKELDDSRFCKRCFPNGNPEVEKINSLKEERGRLCNW